jgi:predicted nuclease of predicted toxin-antitoxin system
MPGVRFIIDAQLPPALAGWLREARHEALHVEDVGLREAEDSPVWSYALQNQSIIITKDEDFALRAQQSRVSPVIVWLRIGNCSKRALREWFLPLLPAMLDEIGREQRLIEVR